MAWCPRSLQERESCPFSTAALQSGRCGQIALNLNLSLGGLTLVNAFVGGIQEMEKKLLPAVPSLWRSWGQTALDGAEASKPRVRRSSRCWPAWCADKKRLTFVVCSSGLTTKAVTFFSGMAPCSRVPRHRAVPRGSDIRCKHFWTVSGWSLTAMSNLTKFARASATGSACYNSRRKNLRDGDTYVEAAIEIRRTSLRTTASLRFSVPETCAVGKVTLALATMVVSQVKVMLPSCLHALVPGLSLVFNPVTWSCTLHLRCPLCNLLEKQMFFIGAPNRHDLLDEALLRPPGFACSTRYS